MAKSHSTRARAQKQHLKPSPAFHKTERQRTLARARKIKLANEKRELTAQWRALKKLGFIKTTVTPAQKRLTKFRKAKIKKAFTDAQKQAVLKHGKVVRVLEKKVINGRIKYDLNKNFKMIHSKFKPEKQPGFRQTLKGFIFELINPDEKIRITKKKKIVRSSRSQGNFTVESEFMSPEEILKLAKDITIGKIHIKGQSTLAG